MIEGAFDASTASYSVWVGESRVLTGAMTVAFALALYKPWPISEQISAIRVEGAEVG